MDHHVFLIITNTLLQSSKTILVFPNLTYILLSLVSSLDKMSTLFIYLDYYYFRAPLQLTTIKVKWEITIENTIKWKRNLYPVNGYLSD